MRKIAIALSKGGVGKTTTAVNLAAGLARAGQRVLLVDMDTQGQSAQALGLRPQVGLAEVVIDNQPVEQAILEAREGISLVAGGRSLAGLKRVIARKEFGGGKMPFVCGRIAPPAKWPNRAKVRKAQETTRSKHYAWIDCDDLELGKDKLHFTLKGQLGMGRKFAAAMLKLMGRRTPKGKD